MIIYVAIVFFFVWLVILTSIILKTKAHYNSLILNTRKHKIDEILDQLLMDDKKTEQ